MTTQENEAVQEEAQSFKFDGPEDTGEPQAAEAQPEATAAPQEQVIPPVGGPAEAPAAAAMPSVAAPPQPTYTQQQVAQLQSEHQRQQQMLQQYQQEMEQRQADLYFRQQEQGLVDMGASGEQAQVMVQQMRAPYEQLRQSQQVISQLQQTQARTVQGAQNMIATVLSLSKKYGVSPESLQNYNSPQAMEAAAISAKRIQDMQNEITALKQGRVPSGQVFESGQGQSISSSAARRQQLRDKDGPLTDAEFAELGKYLGQG